MVNRALIRTLENDPEIDRIWESEVANFEEAGLFQDAGTIGADFEVNKIVEGRILRVEDGNVMVDIGFKSEASVPLDEWGEGDEPPQVGQLVKVLIQDLEDEEARPDEGGMLRVTKRGADKQIQWNEVISKLKEGDPVTGTVERKIKGGLLVDIGGVKVFLPASQVDIRLRRTLATTSAAWCSAKCSKSMRRGGISLSAGDRLSNGSVKKIAKRC